MASDHYFSSNRTMKSLQEKPVSASEEETKQVIRLPNGMVGREFSALLTDHLTESGKLSECENMPLGLAWVEGVLCGVPEQAGEFELAMGSYIITLTIHADPRSLWKNLPSDHEDPFWKADSVTEFLENGPLTVVGASLRGRSHAHVASFRDDDLALAWFPNGSWYSLTVADGAGSASLSRQGSKIACDAVKQHFAQYFATADHGLSQTDSADELHMELCLQFKNAVQVARQKIEEQAGLLGKECRDFHTTLITALMRPLPDGQWFIATFSVGDGAAALVSVAGGAPCLLTCPDAGEYAGQTVFLTMPEVIGTVEAVAGRIQTAVISDFEALLLVTDGVSDPCFESESALADPVAWAALWGELATLLVDANSPSTAAELILRWLEFHSPGHHDDRTLVLASPRLKFPPR